MRLKNIQNNRKYASQYAKYGFLYILDSCIYCAEIKTWRIESRNLPAICYSPSYILRNSKSYCISCPVLFILAGSVKLNTGFACYYRHKDRRERSNARQPPRLSRDFPLPSSHCLLPRCRFFVLVIVRVIRRAAAPIISATERTFRGRQ